MLKIFIVDDEPIVREGIKNTIAWHEYGFEIVGEAADGAEALEQIEQVCPDIVITDICMEAYDGLRLISELRSAKPDIEIIILSGYEKFEYAKKAIESNVFSYLLKPIKNEDLIANMLALKDKIEEKNRTKKAVSTYQSQIQNRYLLRLISQDEEDPAPEKEIALPKEKYLIATVAIDHQLKLGDKFSDVYEALKKTIYYNISIEPHFILHCETEKNNIVLLIFENFYANSSSISAFFKNIMNQFSAVTGNTITIGVSGICHSMEFIRRAYLHSKNALEQKAVQGYNRVIYYTDTIQTDEKVPVLSSEEINAVISAIVTQDQTKAEQILNNYFNSVTQLKTIDINILKNIIIELATLIIHKVIKNIDAMNLLFNRVVYPAAEIWQLETVTEIKAWIFDVIHAVFAHPEVMIAHQYSSLVRQAIFYIMSDYAKQITVNSAAEQLFISSSHLMRLFKKETGKTFNEYLTDYRISLAKHFLENENLSISEVAARVGYTDSKYFSKIYKKLTGCTPQKDRIK